MELKTHAHYHQLTPAEHERLACLAEEASEVVQVIGKILRYGYKEGHPAHPQDTNRQHLERELGDVLGVIQLMLLRGDISAEQLRQREQFKLRHRLPRYLHHNEITQAELDRIYGMESHDCADP